MFHRLSLLVFIATASISFSNGVQSAPEALAIYDMMRYTTIAVYHKDPKTKEGVIYG